MKKITATKFIALLLSIIIMISACGNQRQSTGDELLDIALAAADAQTELYSAKGKLLSKSDIFPAGNSTCDWTALAFSILDVDDDYDAYLSALESYVTECYSTQGGLHRSKATEWHRIALTVAALGRDPENFGTNSDGEPINLIADGTYNFSGNSLGAQGNNAYIFALLTLDSKSFSVPEDSLYTREYILNALLDAQEEDGGFGLIQGASDIDITAMTLQALAPYVGTADVDEAVSKALSMLSDLQNEDGSFSSYNVPSSESCSQIIIALCSLGIDPKEDERFIKNGNSVYDAFMSFKLSNGGFKHNSDSDEADAIATEQAMLALCSMIKMRDGKRLYDFS